VSDPTFSQPERRSYALPIIVALVLLAAAAAGAAHFYPGGSITATHLNTSILPTHTVFKSDSIVVGPAQTSDVLFIVSTVRVDNGSRIPISLDGLSCTFTDPTGAILSVKAVTKQDLPNVETSFPTLKPLVPSLLQPEANIDPGKSVKGTILFSLPFTRQQWETRKSADIQLALYHRDPLTVEIPK
jgi:hypothetical protein